MRSSDHKHGGIYTRELGEKCEIKLDSIQRNRSVAIRVARSGRGKRGVVFEDIYAQERVG